MNGHEDGEQKSDAHDEDDHAERRRRQQGSEKTGLAPIPCPGFETQQLWLLSPDEGSTL